MNKKEMLDAILKEMKDDGSITEEYLAFKYHYSERTIRRYVKILKDTNKIKLIGKGIDKKWIVISDIN